MTIKKCLIQIYVSDLDKAISWYKEKLGMEVLSRWDEWSSATLKVGGVEYDICQPDPKWGANWEKAQKNIGGLRGIFFYTDDINKAYEEMKSKGVEFQRPPFLTPWGEYQAFFVDPDGNEFSLALLKDYKE